MSKTESPKGGINKTYMIIGIVVFIIILSIMVYYFFFTGEETLADADARAEYGAESEAYGADADNATSYADQMSAEMAEMEAKAKAIQDSNASGFEKDQAEANLNMAVANAQAAALEAKNAVKQKQEADAEKELAISQNGRCGPEHENVRCPGKELCSQTGWCGEGDEFDFASYSQYHGPSSYYHDSDRPHSGKCGPLYGKQKCQKGETCSEAGKCGVGAEFEYRAFASYAGPGSKYSLE